MAGTRNSQDFARIHESGDADRHYLIHPKNNDVFVRTGKQVIEACRLDISIELWLSEIGAMLDDVSDWSKARSEKIKSCYCSPTGARISLFFSPVGGQFDFDLSEELTDLTVKLFKKFNVGMIESHQVPFEELDRFIDVQSARLVHGSEFEPHRAVEA
ncbi:hypothetical protein B7486_00900 [cyanobacterium TDX16]|nr:hypothetical protein B7486_00900 [cyanobacterium TDX16]